MDTQADTMPRLAYSVDELAAAVGLSRSSVTRAIRLGHLQARKIGARVLVTVDAADEWLHGRSDGDAA